MRKLHWKLWVGLLGLSWSLSAQIDHDLAEVTIPQLQSFYETRRYTVSQVVEWYIARITKYDGIYQAIESRDFTNARALAVKQDTELAAAIRPPLFGVPIVIKANTSVKGLITTNGWSGFIIPGHELTASADAAVVIRLQAAGAIVIGRTNMPDFAASDTSRSTSFGRTGNATMSASVPADRPEEQSPPSARTSPYSAPEPTPATPSGCHLRQAPWSAYCLQEDW